MPGAGGVTIHPVDTRKMFYTDKNTSLIGTITTVDRESRIYIIKTIDGNFYTLGFEDDFANEVLGPYREKGEKVSFLYNGETMKGEIHHKNSNKKKYVIYVDGEIYHVSFYGKKIEKKSGDKMPVEKAGGRKTLNKRKKNKKSRKARKSRNKYFFF